MANYSTAPKGVPVPAELQAAVKSLLASSAESQVAKRLGLSRTAIARLAAGLTVCNGTLAQVRERLAAGAPRASQPAQLALPMEAHP